MPGLWLARAPHVWIPRITAAEIAAGLAYEQQEQRCDEAYDRVLAPPCPACGKPVRDEEWGRHRYEEHHINQVCQPYGKADAREIILLGVTPEDLDRKKTIWRSRHPGLSLELAAEGKEPRFRDILFQRFRVCRMDGRPVA